MSYEKLISLPVSGRILRILWQHWLAQCQSCMLENNWKESQKSDSSPFPPCPQLSLSLIKNIFWTVGNWVWWTRGLQRNLNRCCPKPSFRFSGNEPSMNSFALGEELKLTQSFYGKKKCPPSPLKMRPDLQAAKFCSLVMVERCRANRISLCHFPPACFVAELSRSARRLTSSPSTPGALAGTKTNWKSKTRWPRWRYPFWTRYKGKCTRRENTQKPCFQQGYTHYMTRVHFLSNSRKTPWQNIIMQKETRGEELLNPLCPACLHPALEVFHLNALIAADRQKRLLLSQSTSAHSYHSLPFHLPPFVCTSISAVAPRTKRNGAPTN